MQSDDRAALKYSSGTGGARGCLSPRAGGTGLVSGGGERLVLCPFPTWELVSALQMGHFRRAALMGTNCSPQPGSSRERTFRGIWFPVGTYTSFGSGTAGGI